MPDRVFNFCAGPCTLPLEVLQEAQGEFVNYQDSGMALIEMSHRSAEFVAVQDEAMALAKEVFGVPDDFEVVLVQGGASLQFAMVPLNFLLQGKKAAYVHSGAWAKKAIADAKPAGEIYTAWDGADGNYSRMPSDAEIALQDDTCYVHITSNETIGGIRYPEFPDLGVPLIADMSSEFLSRPIPWDKFDMVYGGAQKNMGPAGLGIAYIRKSALETSNKEMANYLRYDQHAAAGSMYNTPPVFSVWMLGKVMKWVKANGGLVAMEKLADQKSGLLYSAIDGSDGFYNCPVDEKCRSTMNVVFTLPSDEIQAKFLSESKAAGLMNLKGHRSVGGCRASLYNAMPLAGVQALTNFMTDFKQNN